MSRSGINPKLKVIGITLGDPQGIGAEVIRKALLSIQGRAKTSIVLIGDRKLFRGLAYPIVDVAYNDPGEGSLKFLQRGIDLIKEEVIDALVTAPLSKERVNRFQKGFCGHTEYLADAFNVKRFDMMFISPKMRLSLVTRHVPLQDVPKMITKESVFASIELMDETLREHFAVKKPKIAVLGLNPHAGENGLIGKEDSKSILPAIVKANKRGINAVGPLPADTFFIHDKGYDGVVAMYHDQGLAPLKGLYFKDLVNFTAGLPFVRTSPVHGTAFDIAGKNIADPSSMIAAIDLACRLA